MSDSPVGRAFNAIAGDYAKLMAEEVNRPHPLIAYLKSGPEYGPAADMWARRLSEGELGVEWDPSDDTYIFSCPGFDSEPVYLTGEQVDALAERLLAHRQRRLYQ